MRIYNPITNLFEGSDQYELVKKLGNPLLELETKINWEQFRPILEKTFSTKKNPKGGRPRLDPLKMFKVLILQKMYNLSDHAVEFQIADRMSFQRFIGISSIKEIPDEKTIWLFREQAQQAGLIDKLFDYFVSQLESKGLIVNEGKMVDASLVSAPKQRNSKEENDKIKKGEHIEEWEANQNKKRQKDVDASWTKKHGRTHYGYKNHIKADLKSKLIQDYEASTASVHDSQIIDSITNKSQDKGQDLYGDSAYRSEEIEKDLKLKKIISKIHEKAYRGNPLTKKQKKNNRRKSKKRVRVEHVFGHMETKMGGTKINTIGLERALTQIGLKNLAYNISRAVFLLKSNWRGLSIQKI
jgi:IS5 family transposase